MSTNTKGVIPYLIASNAAEAAEFYKKALAATEIDRKAAGDDKRLMHCHLDINGGALMLCDAFPEYGHAYEPLAGVTLTLIVEDGDLWWNRAIDAGCEVTMPLKLEFWGDRYGQFKDPFGIVWAINEPAKTA